MKHVVGLLLFISWAAAHAQPVTCDPSPGVGCLRLVFTLNEVITQRITEVQVNGVAGVSGSFTAPDPFTAPLLSEPAVAQSQAFSALGVPDGAGGLSTSFGDVADFVMSADEFSVGQSPDAIFIGIVDNQQAAALFESALGSGLVTPGSSTSLPGGFFQAEFGLLVISGQVSIELTRTRTVVDAFRMNISQENAAAPEPIPFSAPGLVLTALLLGLAGLLLQARRARPSASRGG